MKRLTSGQVAKLLGCSIGTVHKIPDSRLPYVFVGTHRRYVREDVEAYLRSCERGRVSQET